MKTKLFFCYIITAVILFASCHSDVKQEPKPVVRITPAEDSTDINTNDSAFSREAIDTFNTFAFSSYAKKRTTGIDWSRFRMTSNWTLDSLKSRKYSPDKKFYDAYGKVLKYSPDSTMFIDLDSYNTDIKKDAGGHWTATEMEADCEVSLVNIRTHRKMQLLFTGPGSSADDAYWLDDENIILIGTKDNGHSVGKTAAVWKYNLPTNTFFLYELKDDAVVKQVLEHWRKERLKDILLQ